VFCITSRGRSWERLLQQVQVAAHAAEEIDWGIAVDSTVGRRDVSTVIEPLALHSGRVLR
jgi:hypothetical protein